VTVATSAFDGAPDSILRGVAQLTWAQEKMIEQTASLFEEKAVKFSSKSMTFESKAFNELLALGYFESSTISVSHLLENVFTV
jgi:hypothetical protein